MEPRLRRVVADTLGVSPDEVTCDVSLVDDLAADSLDLLELVLAVENELGVCLPDETTCSVRTFGDLLAAVERLPSRTPPRGDDLEPASVRVRLVPPDLAGHVLERAGALTAYAAETIAEDAVHAGPGARLDVEVGADTSMPAVAAIRDRFAPLAARGVQVNVRRRLPPGAAPLSPVASASR